MIWPTDGARLAYTKIQTRRIRLLITVSISSLLFVGIAGILFSFRGLVATLEDFSKEGYGSRYIVNAYPNSTMTDVYSNPDVIARAKEIDKDYRMQRKAEAKKLGLDYDPSTETPVTTQFDSPGGKIENLNESAYASKLAIKEYGQNIKDPGVTELKKLAEPYGFTQYYMSQSRGFGGEQSYVKVLNEGKEDFSTDAANSMPNYGDQSYYSLKDFANTWQSYDEELLKPFLLPGQSLEVGEDGAIPILGSYSSLVKILKLTDLPANASAKDKLARLEEVRTKIAGYTYQACYRNSISAERINLAISQQDEITRNKSQKDYVKPELIYALPSEPCADVVVERDVRNADTKKQANKELAFAELFGQPKPESSIVKFKIVGIVSDFGDPTSSTVQQILQSILVSSIGNGWFSGTKAIESNPVAKKLFEKHPVYGAGTSQYYAEFTNPQTARKFMEEQNCLPNFELIASTTEAGSSPDPFSQCRAEGKDFSLNSFGSNSLAIAEFKEGFNRFFRIVLLVVVFIASLIMMGMVARIISDSRRETAVFRAIGAKRLDIAQIYITYVAMICGFISIIAILGGSVIGLILRTKYADELSLSAAVVFNSPDASKKFDLLIVRPQDVLYIVAVIFAVGLLASIIPLATNLSRNPIRDMRDDR